jgi:anti-sigma regulatory factor (Ser/Thr protein kinase)
MGFHHDALLYADADEFLVGTVPFIRAGLEESQPILVAVPDVRTRLLVGELGTDAELVRFADMETLGANPMRIISAWRDFADASPGTSIRGIGEPIWKGRSEEEIVECQRHESLLNLAFANAAGFWLRCPYNTTALSDSILAEAEHSHPHVAAPDHERSREYLAPDVATGPFDGALADPPETAVELPFEVGDLSGVRHFADDQATAAGLSEASTHDLVMAVNELAGNSIRHGGGAGVLTTWLEPETIVCEVTDQGFIDDPLAGRVRPGISAGGRGLWLVSQVCDLVQIRSHRGGTAVRVHMRRV